MARPEQTHTQPPRVPRLLVPWLLFSTINILYDSLYLLLRPLSLPNGSLSPLFTVYRIYGRIDRGYSWEGYHRHDGFHNASAIMNIFDCALTALWLWRWLGRGQRDDVLGMIACALTSQRTFMVALMAAVTGWRDMGGTWAEWLFWYAGLTTMWVVVPAICTCWFAARIREREGDRRGKRE